MHAWRFLLDFRIRERELKKELSEVYQVSEAHIIVKLQE